MIDFPPTAILNLLSVEQSTLLHIDVCPEQTLRILKAQPSTFIVLTNNTCPCYLESLLELQPKALLGMWDTDWQAKLENVVAGSSYFSQWQNSELTPAERRVLRCLAIGLDIKNVAQILGNSVGTVQVHVRNLYGKLRCAHPSLQLDNHVQLALYWRGLWHLLI